MEIKKTTLEIISIKRDEIENLKKEGIDPFGQRFERTHKSGEVIQKFNQLGIGESSQEKVTIAGRMMSLRKHGKAAFADIEDIEGRIQVYIKSNKIGQKAFELFNKTDVGDILGITGIVFRTKTGELTIFTEELTLLCKSVRSLPEKWHGLKDIETRYRKRY